MTRGTGRRNISAAASSLGWRPTKSVRPAPGHESVSWGRLSGELLGSLDAIRRGDDRRLQSFSVSDTVHSVVADMIALDGLLGPDGAPHGPRTHDEAFRLGMQRCLRRYALSSCRAEGRERILAEARRGDPDSAESLERISARNQMEQLITRLYSTLDDEPEARQLLYAVLEFDIDYTNSQSIAELLDCPVAKVEKIRKRVRQAAREIAKTMNTPAIEGEKL